MNVGTHLSNPSFEAAARSEMELEEEESPFSAAGNFGGQVSPLLLLLLFLRMVRDMSFKIGETGMIIQLSSNSISFRANENPRCRMQMF